MTRPHPRHLDRLLTAMLIVVAVLFTHARANADTTVDSIQNGYYTVTVDGEPTSDRFTRQEKAQAAALTAQLANPDAEVRILPPDGWTLTLTTTDDGGDTGGVEPPVITPPTEPGDGFLARAPHADAIQLQTGDDIQTALDTGRDVLLPAGSIYRDVVRLRMHRDGQLLGVYGSGDRPRLEGGNGTVISLEADDITVAGLHITYPYRDPDSPRWDQGRATANEPEAVAMLGKYSGLLIEDCVITHGGKGITLQDRSNTDEGDLVDATLHRNILRYNWTKGDRGAGVYSYRVRGLRIIGNLIDHNGWHPKITGSIHTRGTQAHGCYLNGYHRGAPDPTGQGREDTGPEYVVEFHGNIVSRSSANGVQFRLGGNITDNVFTRNPMALYTRTNDSTVRRNAILEGTDINPDEPFLQRGWGLQVIVGGNYSDNLFANEQSVNGGSHAVVWEARDAEVTGNTFYRWRGPNWPSPVWNKIDSDQYDAMVHDNLTATGDIRETLTDADLERIAGRERGAWGEQYDGAAISEQLRGAYP